MEKISAKQFAFLVFTLRVTHAIVALTEVKLVDQGQDAWVAAALGTLGGTAAIWALLAAAARQPELTLVQRCQAALGSLLGRALGLVFVTLFLFGAMLSMRMFAGLLVAQPMPETPMEAFLLMMAAGASYAAWHGPEVSARLGEVAAPVTSLGILLVLLLLVKDMNLHLLQPVLAWGWWSPLKVALVTTGVHIDLLAILMLVPYLREPRRAVLAGVTATGAAGVLVTLVAAGAVAVYSGPEAQRVLYPLYDLARTISLGEFLERLDLIFIAIGVMSSFLKLALQFWAGAVGLAQVLGLKEHTWLVVPLAYTCTLLALQTYGSVAEFMDFHAPQVLPWFTLPFLVLLPGLLSLTERLRSPGGDES